MSGIIGLVRLLVALLLGVLVARLLRKFLTESPKKSADSQHHTLAQCPVCKDFVNMADASCGRLRCPRGGSPAMALFFLLACLAWPGAARAEGGGRYLVEVKGSNVQAVLTVNGLPAEKWVLPQAGGNAGASLNHWLRQGNNTFQVQAQPVQAGRAAQLLLRIYFLSVANGAETNLLVLDDLAKARNGVALSFNLPSAPALTLWQTQSGALDEGSALSLVGQLRTQLIAELQAGRSVEQIPALAAERTDLAKAFGVPATSQPLVQTAQKREDAIEVSRTLQTGDLQITPVLGTQLFRVSHKGNSPLLAIRQGSYQAVFSSLIVGKVAGQWQILRRSY